VGACEHCTDPAISMNWGEFFDYLLSEESKFHNVFLCVLGHSRVLNSCIHTRKSPKGYLPIKSCNMFLVTEVSHTDLHV